ncbi:MAG: 16S rRNA (guanine(527)-N(7))-methyltransferase RsmG [Acidobacteriia bacterium]|nr:16S rRNA (guanine(527)-N(7))-methyltransferase RsmG [Terriglobia bacterium]
MAAIFQQFGVSLSASQIEQVERYTQLLEKWNAKINLTRIVEVRRIYEEHFGESFYLSRFLPGLCRSLLDVGSGAGFPGIALKILNPRLSLTLVESSTRKVLFLDEVISTLGMASEASVIQARFQQFVEEGEGNFDAATVRGVKISQDLIDCFNAVLRPGGRLIVTTSLAWAKEFQKLRSGRLAWAEPHPIPSGSSRVVLVGERQPEAGKSKFQSPKSK